MKAKVSNTRQRIQIMKRTLPSKHKTVTQLRNAFNLGRYTDKGDLTALQKLIGSSILDSWIIENNIAELEALLKKET